jgi:hypothetical protein
VERGKHKVKLVLKLGEVTHDGRSYKVQRERIVDTGDEYTSIKLYNAKGKFIKRFMIDQEVTKDIGQLLNWANTSILDAIIEAENKAWEALARYKFQMFGYWASIWVHLNRLSGGKRTNPWKKLVGVAKKQVGTIKLAKRLHPAFLDEEDES